MMRGLRGAALRTGRGVSRPAAHARQRSKSARKSPPPQATIPTCWPGMPSRRWWPSIFFILRGGRVVDRRDFYWEDLEEFEPGEFLSSLLKQLYLDAAYLPRAIHVPMDFEDRELLEEILTRARRDSSICRYRRVEILMPQRGPKHAFLELVEKNARHSFEQRFRVLKPSSKAIAEALEQALNLPEPPQAHREFRYFAPAGLGHRGLHGGVGRRAA